ncbi:hypothetical protein JHK85_053514 [Glycine max]|nr:hypothetical protein JHK85_053514 [Glycine max]
MKRCKTQSRNMPESCWWQPLSSLTPLASGTTSTTVQRGKIIFPTLSSYSTVQLAQIQLRVLEYGWTMQKVFHFLNILVNEGRCKKMQEVYNLMMGYSYSSLLHFDPELGGVGLAYSRLLFLKEEV